MDHKNEQPISTFWKWFKILFIVFIIALTCFFVWDCYTNGEKCTARATGDFLSGFFGSRTGSSGFYVW